MNFIQKTAACCVAFAVLAVPGVAQAGPVDDAEALRKLDIMLMVTSLRCRTTKDDFQADYRRFSSNNLAALNAAARTLKADMVRKTGSRNAKRVLDKMSVNMANQYGNGHPWLGCGELKQIARDLSQGSSTVQLSAAADELLSNRPRGQWAMASAR